MFKPTELQKTWIEHLKPFNAYVQPSTGEIIFQHEWEDISLIWSIEIAEDRGYFRVAVCLDADEGYIDLLEKANDLNKIYSNLSFYVEMGNNGNYLILSTPWQPFSSITLDVLYDYVVHLSSPLIDNKGNNGR